MKYEDEYLTNIAEMFASDDEKTDKTKSKIYLDELNLSKGHFVMWDQNKDKTEKKKRWKKVEEPVILEKTPGEVISQAFWQSANIRNLHHRLL